MSSKLGVDFMAEFCLECWNKINDTNDDEKKYIISRDLDFCEECGEWKRVIVAERQGYFKRRLKFFLKYIWK